MINFQKASTSEEWRKIGKRCTKWRNTGSGTYSSDVETVGFSKLCLLLCAIAAHMDVEQRSKYKKQLPAQSTAEANHIWKWNDASFGCMIAIGFGFLVETVWNHVLLWDSGAFIRKLYTWSQAVDCRLLPGSISAVIACHSQPSCLPGGWNYHRKFFQNNFFNSNKLVRLAQRVLHVCATGVTIALIGSRALFSKSHIFLPMVLHFSSNDTASCSL